MDRVEAYLGLGTNLGDRKANLSKALRLLDEAMGVHYDALSDFYDTEPWGFESPDRFLNAVVRYILEVPRGTSESVFAHRILGMCKDIEHRMGRTEVLEHDSSGNRIYHSRIIDIDILTIGDWKISELDLEIPHPLMHERDFVMVPFRQVRRNHERDVR